MNWKIAPHGERVSSNQSLHIPTFVRYRPLVNLYRQNRTFTSVNKTRWRPLASIATSLSDQDRPKEPILEKEQLQRSRKIAFAVDGTKDAEKALEWTAKNIARKGDTIHLANVMSDPRTFHTAVGSSSAATQWAPARLEGTYAHEFFLRQEHEAKTMIQSRFVPSLQFTGLNSEIELIRLRVQKSAAAIGEALSARAAEIGADMLVIASHGAGVLADYGSVARWCSDHSSVPCLLIPPDIVRASDMPKTATNTIIVAAPDNLEALHTCFTYAVNQLAKPGDTLLLIHMIQPGTEEESMNARKTLVREVAIWQQELAQSPDSQDVVAKMVTVTCDVLDSPAGAAMGSLASIGPNSFDDMSCPAGEHLCAYAKDLGARAVVLAHHGQHLMKEMMFGPITAHVTRHCCAPLMVWPHT